MRSSIFVAQKLPSGLNHETRNQNLENVSSLAIPGSRPKQKQDKILKWQQKQLVPPLQHAVQLIRPHKATIRLVRVFEGYKVFGSIAMLPILGPGVLKPHSQSISIFAACVHSCRPEPVYKPHSGLREEVHPWIRRH